MKKPIFLLLAVFFTGHCFAQLFSPAIKQKFHSEEDSLIIYSDKVINGINPKDRFLADSIFTKVLVRTLKTTNSFYYPFDSLLTVSKLCAPDSSFRLFTWQLILDDNIILKHGAIQMRTKDGSLKLFPLIDRSMRIQNVEDTVTDNKSWIGVVYYKIIETQFNGHNYYTLLGYDEDNIRCNRKMIDILTFDDAGNPVFGGDYFAFEKTSLVEKPAIARFIMEFKKDASPKLNYDADMHIILVEHLESETGEPNKKWTLIPDGDYEGFRWLGGKWAHIDKVFNQITPEGQAPLPAPLKDNGGNLLDNKLNYQPADTTKPGN